MQTSTFDEISADFLRITGEVVWATVATVDTRGRPRTRVLHPYWEVVDGRPVGWVATSKSPLKARHLAANPYLSASYWSPKQETVYADCRAEWADDERERVWQLYLDADPPLGYDPATMPPWTDGPLGGGFAVLRLDPWRITVLTAEAAAAGRFYDAVWTSGA
jgi:Pyridoxamine 5'-phosphate oxidase